MRSVLTDKWCKLWMVTEAKRHKITGPTARTTYMLNCCKTRTQSNRTELTWLTDWMTELTCLHTTYLPTDQVAKNSFTHSYILEKLTVSHLVKKILYYLQNTKIHFLLSKIIYWPMPSATCIHHILILLSYIYVQISNMALPFRFSDEILCFICKSLIKLPKAQINAEW